MDNRQKFHSCFFVLPKEDVRLSIDASTKGTKIGRNTVEYILTDYCLHVVCQAILRSYENLIFKLQGLEL